MELQNKLAPEPVEPLSNRTFGLIFAAIFLVIACWPLISGLSPRRWAMAVAVFFSIPALVFPNVLTPLNALWVKLGLLMHKIVNPILMGLVFFVAVLPTGIIIRLLGKDPMHRSFKPENDSYWINREPDTLSKEAFDNQF